MWKVLIADDEPKIRKGLKNSLNWNELDMEIVGEAEDGEIAFEVAKAAQPDILLLDICMPFLNGLQLIEQLNGVLADYVVIVITGHDEFSYAQQALKLKVFDYLLKPVMRDQLLAVLNKAKEELEGKRFRSKYMGWAGQQLKRNLPYLKERFMNEWINGHVTGTEVEEHLKFFEIYLAEPSGMLVARVIERLNMDEMLKEWDRYLLLFAIQNIIEELLGEWQPSTVFRDGKDNIVAITPIKVTSEWLGLGAKFEAVVEKYLKQVLVVCQQQVEGGISGIPDTYERLIAEVNEKKSYTPIVLLAKKYIEANYPIENLSLEKVAEEVQISPAYLSRLLKQEVGVSFVDYLTQIRVKRAVQLMNDPTLKVYEVAEQVGYRSQHYFSTAFKKVLGVSPIEYRKGGKVS